MKWIALITAAVICGSPASAQSLQELWGADTCEGVRDVMSFDIDQADLPPEYYAEGLANMTAAFGFVHGFAVANGWHEVEGFDYVAEFRDACETNPGRPPIMILIHLF